ncbi:hypothetical protein BC351_12300 [Paenibacillus ferrarius]|uniref:Peptidase S8/S53 domain-containing protein n=1 Tax=Paenibacillus ferrarius TaxID=1469647 RepID=A0A1V4H7T8_9BACL|nr:S8 family serine peptidase [Paenibacillus ferrarius]OPH47273.1 hypothetical protein BC351_12300 [Paenibacillus ferrarius]
MQKRILSFLLIITILFSLISPTFAEAQDASKPSSNGNNTTAGSYIIKFKDAEKGKQALKKNKRTKRSVPSFSNDEEGKTSKNYKHLTSLVTTDLSASEVDELKLDSNVTYIEKDSVVKKAGDTVNGNVYQIHVPEVHDQGIYGDGVKVAVLDTGINTHSPELRVSGGASFVPNDASLDDTNGHGTFVAGILAALKDNQGLVGVAPNVSLYNVKVLDSSGEGTYSQVIQGIDWAIDNHVDMVVMSFTGSDYSAALEEATQLAYSNGILLVAATGNDGVNTVSYPAKFSSVIGVGAVDENNQLASFSNTGAEVELVAPGVSVKGLSLVDGSYITMSGTSVAVPQVAGVAALIKSKDYLYTNKEIRQFLDNSAVSLGDPQFFGHGLVNASEVLNITGNAPHTDNNAGTGSVSQSVYDSVYIEKRINELNQKFNIPILLVNEQLNKGYSINDIEQALIFKQHSNWDLGKILEVIRPRNLFSSVPQVKAAAESFMTAVDATAVGTVNLKADKAPFTLGSSAEVSTLTGAVTVNESDLTLPGRNGLSFTLSRIYNSQNSNFYKQDTEPVQAASYQVTFNSYRYTQTRRGDIITDSVKTPSEDSRNYSTYSDGGKAITWINSHPGQVFDFTDWDGPASDGSFTRSVTSISSTPNARQTYFQISPIAYFRNTATQKTKEELRFPIGQGWSWNIPYVEPDYIRLPDGSTQGFNKDDGTLKTHFVDDYSYGYPKKTVTVDKLTAQHELHYKTNGLSYYFESNGKLIEIEDTYGNTIQFFYTNDQLYGQVLSEIRDAIGNSINIKYYDNQVILTQGDKKVIYNKTKRESTFLDKPWNNTTKDLLTSVENPKGNITQYNYLTDNDKTYFNFAGNSSGGSSGSVEHALLRSIQYPSGAQSIFTYESSPVTRYVGAYATTQEFRAKSRQEQIGDGKVYNLINYNYVYDIGSSFSDDEFRNKTATSVTDVTTDKITTRYTYLKKYVNFKKVYGTPGCETGIQWSTCWPSSTDFLFFQTNVTGTADNMKKRTELTYDTDHNNPYPLKISSDTTNVLTGQISMPVVAEKTYNSHGQILTEKDTYGTKTDYEYKDLSTVGSFLSKVTKKINTNLSQYIFYDRNPQGSVTWLTVRNNDDPNGAFALKIGYDYDSYGNQTKMTATDNQSTKTINKTYEPSAPYSSAFLTKQDMQVTDVDQKITTNIQQLEYNPTTGQQTKYTDGKGYYTRYEYDLLDRVTKATFMDNSKVTLTYDDANNKITTEDETGIKKITQWNPLGLKESVQTIGAGTGKQSFQYDTYSRLWKSLDERSNVTEYQYDPWNRVKQVIHPTGSESIEYDDINRTKITEDGEKNRLRETYDILGRTTQVARWKNGTWTQLSSVKNYDNEGHALEATDADDTHVTKYGYDLLGRLTSVEDANKNATLYSYGIANKITEVKYADGNKAQKQYDEMGRMIRKIDSAGLIDKYYYDDNSNLIKQVDRKGQTLEYQYNTRDFLKYSISPNETISYEYDTAGRRLWMQDGTGKTSYKYFPLTGLMDTTTYADGRTINYGYGSEGLGNRVSMTDPFGYNTAYDFDNRNRLKGVGDTLNNWETSYTYKKNGLVDTSAQKNGIISTYGFDGANLTSLVQKNNGGTNLNVFAYSYDNNSNQTSKTENSTPYSFTYDKLNRIDTSTQFNEQYIYDNRGNRQTLQSNQVPNLAGVSYEYDDRNRLTKVTMDDGKVVAYKYNGDGLLYERTENGQTTRYYYDGANMIAEGIVAANGTASLKARYIRGNGLVARVDANGNKAYYQINGHGDVVGLTDASGNTLNTYTYDMWGNPITTQETVAQPFRYSGEMTDSTTGLQYLRARWYDPSMGRFINEDTYEGQIDNPLSLNLYTYVMNNPLTHTDPTGHCGVCGMSSSLGSALSGAAGAAGMAGLGSGSAGTLDPAAYYYSHSDPYILDNDPYIDPKTLLPPSESTKQWIADEREMIIFQQKGQEKLNATVIQQPIIDNSAYILMSSSKILYHYTDEAGAKAIMESGVIISNRGKVYLTDQAVSPDDANNVLFAGQRPGFIATHRIEVEIYNDYYDLLDTETQDNELIFRGSIRNGKNANITVKENN